MKYLLILNKFELSVAKLKTKIKDSLKDSKFSEDNGLILETNEDIKKILYFEEIEKILPLYQDWKAFDFKTFKETFADLKIKTHLVKTNFISSIPISSKEIIKKVNSALNSKFSENPEKVIYIEFIKKEKPYYRVFITPFNYWEKFKMEKKKLNFEIVLENPENIEEIKDFLRLCYIFEVPLNILTEKNIDPLINKAKQEAKGIPYEKFTLNINKKLDGIKIGFSINSEKDEKDFKEFYSRNKDKKISLIFGNDKFGLSQELRDKLDYSFRLTQETKKPLRASHALSYILGLIN
ncbi:MAG: hypothetical protein WC413_01970 [Candidatus Nanoarchaeia archaeon]